MSILISGDELRKYLKINDITIESLIKKVGVSRQTFYNIFEKSKVPEDFLIKLKKFAGIDALQIKADTNYKTLEVASSIVAEKSIPYYDMDVSASNISMFTDSPELPTQQISIPGLEDCDFGVPVFGHSMYPTYENGVIILCKKITDKTTIIYGECYLIITKDHRFVKRIQKSKDPESVLLVSDNDEVRKDGSRRYEPFDLPNKKILHLFIIKGTFKRNQL